MKNSDSRYWLIPLLAAFAIYVPFSSIPSTPDQQPSAQQQFPALVQLVPLPTPTPTPAPSQDRVSGEAAKLLCDYFGSKQNLDRHAQGRTGPQDFAPKNLRGDYCRVKLIKELNRGGQPAPDKQDSDEYEIEYMIATLPDPKDSRFDHLFDRFQDAIQRAIARAGYIFDRYWLPWDRSRTAAPVALPTDPRAPQMAMSTRYLYEPGVILFRDIKDSDSSRDVNRLLLLFLVGETPTSGIHKVAFKNALWQIKEIAGWKGSKPEKKELRILSPCFSGSDASLATLLKAWIHEHKDLAGLDIRIVSGSAATVREDLLEEIAPGKVRFQSTVIREKRAMEKFYEYLEDRDPRIKRDDDGPQVAWLSEAVTASGQRVRETGRKKFPTLSLTFPLHISQLRIEATKISLQRDEIAKAKALTAKAPDIALPMREAGSPTSKDIVPLYSQVETVTMDLTLDEALSAIRRERIRYVGMTSSDVQDRIFLVREIRKQCPNVTIFIWGNDLLYLHSESYLDFQGALIISPYPLFGLNQLWTYPFKGYENRAQFSNQAAQGVYNATLALLKKEYLMLEYGCPLQEYGNWEWRYPALWLGIVGSNRIWPVRAFDVFDSKKPPEKASYTLPVPHGPASSGHGEKPKLGLSGNFWLPTGIVILLLIGGICLVLSLVCMTQSILFWGRSKKLNQYRKRRFSLGRPIVVLSKELEREIKEERKNKERKVRVCLRPFAWVRRGWLGQVFGEEVIYRYHRDRRIYVMCCCFSLVAITFFISIVAMLPAWIRYEMAKGEYRYPALFVNAGKILVLALARICWPAASITRRHLRWLLGAWVAPGLVVAMITFVIKWYQDLLLGVIAAIILGFALSVLFWLVYRPAVSLFKWVIGEFKGESFSQRNPDAPTEMAPRANHPIDRALRFWRYFHERIEAVVALGMGMVMVIFVVSGLIEIFHAKTPGQIPEQIFFFLRATELASGVSVLLPALLIGLAAFLSFLASLQRLNLAERMPYMPKSQKCPDDENLFLHFDHAEAKSFKGLKFLENRVKEMIVCSNAPREASAVFVIFILYWILYLHYFIPSVDGRGFDWFFRVGFFVAPLLLALAFLRFVGLWVALRRLLRRLSWHPLISQYAAKHSEEKRFASLGQVDLMTPPPTYTSLSASVRQARSFYTALKRTPERAETKKKIKELVEVAEKKLSDALNFHAQGAWQDALKNRRGAEEALADLTKHVTSLLEDSWFKSGEPDVGWRDKGRFFLITHLKAFLQHIFGHLQNLVMMVTVGLVLLLVATNFYPFRPRESLLLFSWVAILTSVAVTLIIFVQESRDKTLSLLNGRTPGKLNFTRDFVMRVLFHGVVPVILLLGVQFPEAVRQIFSWLSVFEGKGG